MGYSHKDSTLVHIIAFWESTFLLTKSIESVENNDNSFYQRDFLLVLPIHGGKIKSTCSEK